MDPIIMVKERNRQSIIKNAMEIIIIMINMRQVVIQ